MTDMPNFIAAERIARSGETPGEGGALSPALRWRRRHRRASLTLGCAAVLSAAALLSQSSAPDLWQHETGSIAETREIARVALDTALLPVSAVDAEHINASRENDLSEVAPAAPFAIRADLQADYRFEAALGCLTQAVYYEAGSETESGQRAVAQVVLNRVRHPAFPNSVCGVVYQGSELPTGCQFTFTCDGSLARQPSLWAWARARRVALAALSGWVESSVGTATNYHASYVVPYWAASLDKVRTVGAHIFYMIPGAAGARSAFVARYDLAAEVPPASLALALPFPEVNLEELGASQAAVVSLPSVNADFVTLGNPQAQGGQLRTAPGPALIEDERRGELIAGARESKLLVD